MALQRAGFFSHPSCNLLRVPEEVTVSAVNSGVGRTGDILIILHSRDEPHADCDSEQNSRDEQNTA